MKVVDHKKYCKGDKTCKKCGRRMCNNCGGNICLVCRGYYKEDEINLFPIPRWKKWRKRREGKMKFKFEGGDEVKVLHTESPYWKDDMTDFVEDPNFWENKPYTIRLKGGLCCKPETLKLIKEAKMSKYDVDTVRAIKKSIEHHEDNLVKLRKRVGEFSQDRSHKRILIGKVCIDYGDTECALCVKFSERGSICNTRSSCPLSLEGYNCNTIDSPWEKILQSETRTQAIIAEENMVKVLKSLLEGEEEDFAVGNKIKVIVDTACRPKGHIGIIAVYPYENNRGRTIKLKNGCCFYPNDVIIIKEEEMEKKEMSIKERIEGLTGWDKEANDILQEIFANGTHYYLKIGIGNWNNVTIEDSNKHKLETFCFSDECEKLEAFKKALLWLAEKSGKLKDVSIKIGDYVVALDTNYWQSYLGQNRVGEIFKVHRITQGKYYYCDEKNEDINCTKEDIRKATKEEIEKGKLANSKKIARREKVKRQMEDLEGRMREIKGELERLKR